MNQEINEEEAGVPGVSSLRPKEKLKLFVRKIISNFYEKGGRKSGETWEKLRGKLL